MEHIVRGTQRHRWRRPSFIHGFSPSQLCCPEGHPGLPGPDSHPFPISDAACSPSSYHSSLPPPPPLPGWWSQQHHDGGVVCCQVCDTVVPWNAQWPLGTNGECQVTEEATLAICLTEFWCDISPGLAGPWVPAKPLSLRP